MNSATNLPGQPSVAGVAVGTLITLADGSTKPVEQIVPGEKVRSGDGEPDTVAIVRRTTAPAVLRLKTAAGHNLACSPQLPLLRPIAVRDALRKLETGVGDCVSVQGAVGEAVLCEGGSTWVISFVSEGEVDVFSLELSRRGPYIANGLLIGGSR